MKDLRRLCGFLITAALILSAYGAYDELCARFEEGQKFREPGNCLTYVTCKNGTGTLTTCPTNQLYDKENKKCVATLTDEYCNNPCKAKSDVWVMNPTNCHGYYYCSSGEAVPGTCHDGFHFHEKTQMCTYSTDSTCAGVSNFCGILPNSAKFADPDNCDKYFQCTKNEQKTVSCKAGLYYDTPSGNCISKYEVSCEAHPLPAKICGTDAKPINKEFVNDGASCRGYFYCAYLGDKLSDKNPTWNQCPEGLFFQSTTQSCNFPHVVPCLHNRCEGRENMLVLASDLYCQHYHVCENGLSLEKRKCPRDMFFDEQRQACVFQEIASAVCD